ncbi:MAG: hypothetical protein HRU03_06195 [Nanoarchaeales archaeon]|nr:hypothetical protein [Nanoarchaeales archaeon]
MESKALESLGLTKTEIDVFIALLELRSSTAKQVIENTKLQNAVVHRAFNSLKDKGLLTYTFEGKIRKYQSIEPSGLLTILDENKSEMKKLILELEQKRNLSKPKPLGRIYEGKKGIKELLNLMIQKENSTYYAYGGPKKAEELLTDYFWDGFHKRRVSNNISAKLIFHTSLKDWKKKLNKIELTQVKLTNKNFEAITETIICDNKVAIIIYLDTPFGFLIDEEKAANSYMEFFKILWNQV